MTNLGACGSTMLKKGNSPFWQRPQYTALTQAPCFTSRATTLLVVHLKGKLKVQATSYKRPAQGKWDVITIMLGTNDAKDPGSHGPDKLAARQF